MFHSLLTLWTVARQTPLSMEFSQQEYRSGLPSPPLGDLPSGFFTTSITWVMGLPDSSDGKGFYSAGNSSLILGLGRFPLRREWQPTPVFLPGELHGQRSLAGYSLWYRKETDMTVTNSLFYFQLGGSRGSREQCR